MDLKFSLLFLVVQSIISVNGLKCYLCTNCENSSVMNMDCPDADHVCLKMEMDGIINKSCTPKTICDLKDMSKDMNKMLKSIGSDAHDTEMPKEMQKIECCYSDYCNAGNVPATWMGLSGALSISLLTFYFLG